MQAVEVARQCSWPGGASGCVRSGCCERLMIGPWVCKGPASHRTSPAHLRSQTPSQLTYPLTHTFTIQVSTDPLTPTVPLTDPSQIPSQGQLLHRGLLPLLHTEQLLAFAQPLHTLCTPSAAPATPNNRVVSRRPRQQSRQRTSYRVPKCRACQTPRCPLASPGVPGDNRGNA